MFCWFGVFFCCFGVSGGFLGFLRGLHGARELLSTIFKEVLPTVRPVIKLLCILRVVKTHKTQIHPSTFTWARFDRGETENGMQFNLSFNSAPSWDHTEQKDPVFVSMDNHTDSVLPSEIKQEVPTQQALSPPCLRHFPLLNYLCLGCSCHRSLEQLPSFKAGLLILWPFSLSQMSKPTYTCRISIISFLGRPNLSVTGNLHNSHERQEPSCSM